MNIHTLLNTRFGYADFRPGQEEVIRHVLNRNDTIAILPTGMGKSLCYQLPGYVMAGAVIIISPLVSLMEDQVMQMRRSGEKRVVALNSFLAFDERKRIIKNLASFKFIFISPEMLSQEALRKQLDHIGIALVVVDEAHCISQWGFDFRPDYLRIGESFPFTGKPPILALTATADKKVVDDICAYLHMDKPVVERQSLDRPNITYSILELDGAYDKTDWIKNRLIETTGPGVIYTASRKRADELAAELQAIGISVQSYHAGKEQDDRSIIQEQFLTGELDWICATNAFGMGVHKADIRQVIHEHLPSTVAGYIQEVGRAGRDGLPSAATLLYTPMDERSTSFIIQSDLPTERDVRHYLNMLAEGNPAEKSAELAGLTETGKRVIDYYKERFPMDEILSRLLSISTEKDKELQKMMDLIQGNCCIREVVLSYFGEQCGGKPERCCSVCGFSSEDWLIRNVNSTTKQMISWDERITNLLG